MQRDLTSILLAVVIMQLLLLALFLFTQEKGKRLSNLLLGFFFLCLGLNLADGFLLYQNIYFQYPSFALWGTALTFALGPLLWLYTKSVLFKDFFFSVKLLLHFIPFILLQLLTSIGYLLLPETEKIKLLQQILDRQLHVSFNSVSLFIFAHFFCYLYFSWRLVMQYKKIVANKFSDFSRSNINWLLTLQFFFGLFFLLGIINTFIYLTEFAGLYSVFFVLLVSALFVFVNRVVLKAMGSAGLFSAIEESETKEIKEVLSITGQPVLQKKEDPERLTLKNILLNNMQVAKPYLNPDLSLDELAKSLQVKPRLLSEVINGNIGQSFFDFINHHRIEEAKKILSDPKNHKITVLEVLYEVGFNSKSSFNTIFKKQTGITPSEFKKAAIQKRSDLSTA